MIRMSEAEVSLRLALWLIKNELAEGTVDVAIDGAQIKTGETVHFKLGEFLAACEWRRESPGAAWQGLYCSCSGGAGRVRIHSNPGTGDVVAKLKSGHTLRVECKKGPLERSKSSAEYPLLREALGQLLTVERVNEGDILAVAVPHSPKFEELARRWREAPLIKKFGVRILTVGQDSGVDGLEL
ncbi:MAG: hypothetical protein ACREI1_11710 [Nitrospiraceae bacterium]